MREKGWDVTVVASPDVRLAAVAERERVRMAAVSMSREIDLRRDAVSLVRLVRLVRRLRPDVVVASTPKAGLLGMLAAWAAGVSGRVYGQWGLRLETTTGLKRRILWVAEWAACRASGVVHVAGPSLGAAVVRLGLAPPGKTVVLGAGSTNGVEVSRFESPNPVAVAALRATVGIPEGTPVVGFVGRFTRDKGIAELVGAFERLRASRPGLRLLLVGSSEEGDPVEESVLDRIRTDPDILTPGYLDDPAASYALMSVLAFPSYREGFPNVPLEAAAAGLPVVAASATGSVDAVVDGHTGSLVPVGNAGALADGLAVRQVVDLTVG